jgi:hypothetical protein
MSSARGLTAIYNGGLTSGSGREMMKISKGMPAGMNMDHVHRQISASGRKPKSGGRRRRRQK